MLVKKAKKPEHHLKLAIEGILQNVVVDASNHTHDEYALHNDVGDAFKKVTKTFDDLIKRLQIVEETLAGMQDNQNMVDDAQEKTLRDVLQRMSDFTTEIKDKLDDN